MKSIFLFLLTITFSSMACFAQSDFIRSVDEKTGFTVFQGQCQFSDLLQEKSFDWMQRNSKDYQPDTNALKYLKIHLGEYELTCFMGTWCDDSHLLVPKLYKVLETFSLKDFKFFLFGVNRNKETKNVESQLFKVDRIPVFILFHHHLEIGRIKESVHKSIEQDLVDLIYKHQLSLR